MTIPGPRQTILEANFDVSIRQAMLAAFEALWRQCDDQSDLTGYRLAGGILEIATSGQHSRESIEQRAAAWMQRAH